MVTSYSGATFPVQDHKGNYPCVFKIGHAHGGLGKVRVENSGGFQVMMMMIVMTIMMMRMMMMMREAWAKSEFRTPGDSR